MREHGRRNVDDSGWSRTGDAVHEDGDERVAGDEGAVRAAAAMVAAPEILELPSLRRRHDHVPGVRASKRCGRADDRVGMVEDRRVAVDRDPSSSSRSSAPSRRATSTPSSWNRATSTDGSPSSRAASVRADGASAPIR